MELYDDNGRIQHAAMLQLMTDVVSAALDARLGEMETQVSAMYGALTGNGLGVSEGLIKKVHDLEACDQNLCARIAAIEQKLDRVKWTTIGLAAGLGAASGSLITLISRAIGG